LEKLRKMQNLIKTVWEESDITGGLFVVRTDSNDIKKDGFLASVMSIIGWHSGIIETSKLKEKDDYCLISTNDGMVSFIHSRKTFADELNKGQNYRPATKEEIFRVMNYRFGK